MRPETEQIIRHYANIDDLADLDLNEVAEGFDGARTAYQQLAARLSNDDDIDEVRRVRRRAHEADRAIKRYQSALAGVQTATSNVEKALADALGRAGG